MVLETYFQESRTKKGQRDHIVNKAFELFIHNGIQNVTMIDIANAAEIQRRTLYNYYNNKEELALEVMKATYMSPEARGFYKERNFENGFLEVRFTLTQLYDYLMIHTDVINFYVQFDYYFQKEYRSEDYESFIIAQTHQPLPLVQSFQKGIDDGSIKKRYEGHCEETVFAIFAAIMGMAQRVIFREERTIKETGFSKTIIKNTIDIILEGIKNCE